MLFTSHMRRRAPIVSLHKFVRMSTGVTGGHQHSGPIQLVTSGPGDHSKEWKQDDTW